jgi:hypothetical protein
MKISFVKLKDGIINGFEVNGNYLTIYFPDAESYQMNCLGNVLAFPERFMPEKLYDQPLRIDRIGIEKADSEHPSIHLDPTLASISHIHFKFSKEINKQILENFFQAILNFQSMTTRRIAIKREWIKELKRIGSFGSDGWIYDTTKNMITGNIIKRIQTYFAPVKTIDPRHHEINSFSFFAPQPQCVLGNAVQNNLLAEAPAVENSSALTNAFIVAPAVVILLFMFRRYFHRNENTDKPSLRGLTTGRPTQQ